MGGIGYGENWVWHHWLNGNEFEQILGDVEGQGSLVGCSPWGRKESDMTQWLKNNIQFQGFPGGSAVKSLPAMQEMQIQSLGQEDPLEEEMATQSCILAWEIPWSEEPGGLQTMVSQRVGHDWVTKHTHAVSQYFLRSKADSVWQPSGWIVGEV